MGPTGVKKSLQSVPSGSANSSLHRSDLGKIDFKFRLSFASKRDYSNALGTDQK